MKKLDKHDVIINAVERMKKGQFGLTAIKVELEANLNRRYSDNDDECDDGRVECYDCEGSGEYSCYDCDGEGTRNCSDCEGEGHQIALDDDGVPMTMTTGYGSRYVYTEADCDRCSGEGSVECSTCDGNGQTNCTNCEGEGDVECQVCADGRNHNRDWESEINCHDYLLSRLVDIGLAERSDGGYAPHGTLAYEYRPVFPLVYSRFYNDGSVDSEWTFTLSMENPESVFMLPKFLELFSDLANEIGGGIDTQGAGMHIALLNSSDCSYPYERTSVQQNRFGNYKRSMQLLIPALFFLGSPDNVSRPLHYRKPQIEMSKYSAVNYNGALEFRVFETCYKRPEAILDDVVVMANTLKYWRDEFKSCKIERVCRQVRFGNDKDRTLNRFFLDKDQLLVLNKGIQQLKPAYATIGEVKKQRSFNITKRTIDSSLRKARVEVEKEYKEYEYRFEWQMKMEKYNALSDLAARARNSGGVAIDEIAEEHERLADEVVESCRKDKQSINQYVTRRLDEIRSLDRGDTVLRGA